MAGAAIIEGVNEALRSLNDELGGVIAGFWIRPDPYSDEDEAVVLMLVDFVDNDGDESERSRQEEQVAESVDVCDRVAAVLDPLIPSTCWFTTGEDFRSEGPPLDPNSFHRLEAAPSPA